MILMIDDNINRLEVRYNAKYLYDNEYIRVIHELPKFNECKEYDIIMMHDSILPDGRKNDLQDDIIDARIPLVLFSNGAEYATTFSDDGLKMTSDELYANLKEYLEEYGKGKTHLDRLAYGKKILLEKFLRIESELVTMIYGSQNDATFHIPNKILEYFKELNVLSSIEKGTTYSRVEIKKYLSIAKSKLSI